MLFCRVSRQMMRRKSAAFSFLNGVTATILSHYSIIALSPSPAAFAHSHTNLNSNSNSNNVNHVTTESNADQSLNPVLIPPLQNIVVVGGTHGNEYTGIWCIKALDATSEKVHETYSSLKISTLLANPKAYLENRRFIDHDLNRQFTKDSLLDDIHDINPLERMDESDNMPKSIESLRAREIDRLLGPKFSSSPSSSNSIVNPVAAADVVVDLHTTTTNMGITIIVAEGDVMMTRAAAYVLRKFHALRGARSDDGDDGEYVPVRCLLHTHPDRGERPNVASAGRHGFSIEVGPVPQGVLRHDAVEKTQLALDALLEYLEMHNTDPEVLDGVLREYFDALPNDDGDDGDGDRSSGSGSGSGREVVPCYRTARATKKGQMSGKIPWPSSPDNPNFPLLMVHKNLQDRDFEQIRTGDPLFVDLEGRTVPYDGSHGSPVFLIFVNEGGYYYESSGTGIAVAEEAFFDLGTGVLVER